MKNDSLGSFVNQIVQRVKVDGGVTADFRSRAIVELKNVWLYPKYPSKTLIFPSTASLVEHVTLFINKHRKLLLDSDCYFGIWMNPITHEYYLDINTTKSSQKEAIIDAVKRSKEEGRNIVSIYNPLRKQVVFLDKYF